MGVSATGPASGGLFAATQSTLMGGGCAALVIAFAWPVAFLATVATGAAALVTNEWHKAQKHLMGRVNGLVKGMTWAIVAHNWGKGVEIRSYASEDEAEQAFPTAHNMRRILLRLSSRGAPLKDNGWGWKLPWKECKHTGCRPDLDNEMRRELLGALSKAG